MKRRIRQIRFVWLAMAGALLGVSSQAGEPSSQHRVAYARPATIPFPASNPYTPEKAALGKMLFFETRLSRDRNLSCASCHSPSFGWEVPFTTAIGASGTPLGRHAPTVINLAWTKHFFWDGRADSLEEQVRGPIEAPVEMDLPMAEAVERLQAVRGYRDAFAKAFPRQGLTEQTIMAAIGVYERTLMTPETPFDRWIAGDLKAISDQAQRGFALFNGKAGCARCHTGWNFTDDAFHDIGMPTADVGRMAVSGDASDRHAFKTPGLRDIEARAPYMHNGLLPNLSAVIEFYSSGGVPRDSRSALIEPFKLSATELSDLVAFLKTLSSPQSAIHLPHLPAN